MCCICLKYLQHLFLSSLFAIPKLLGMMTGSTKEVAVPHAPTHAGGAGWWCHGQLEILQRL